MPGAWVELRRASDRRFVLGAFLLVVFATLGYWRESISLRLVPDPRMNQKLERAQAALAHGKLSASDGSGARELFESVLAADPDQMVARQGLVDVRNAAMAGAEAALRARRLQEARSKLALAQALSVPTVQLQPLEARLRDLEEASADTASLLAQAATPGTSAEQALALLEKVISLDADNRVALEGRDELLAASLLRAEKLLADGKVAEAQRLVEKVMATDPAHTELPPVRARLGEALARLQREREHEFTRARADERAGRVDAAARCYLRLASAGDDSAQLQEALARLAARAARDAERQAADFDFKRAEASLAKATQWSPQAAEIAIARQRLAQARLAQRKLPTAVARRDRERLPTLLADAEQAMADGDFITPPGTSAWDKLRIAASISPSSPAVKKVQAEFARRSRDCFEQAMTAGHLKRAQSCLEANLAQEPAAAGAAQARHRLADRWLAYADERIGASDFVQAQQAIDFARHWQPGHPALQRTTARLRRARGGGR